MTLKEKVKLNKLKNFETKDEKRRVKLYKKYLKKINKQIKEIT